MGYLPRAAGDVAAGSTELNSHHKNLYERATKTFAEKRVEVKQRAPDARVEHRTSKTASSSESAGLCGKRAYMQYA
jgi:hypothetical protein